MKKFFLNLQFLFMPHYWIMNEPFSKEVDLLMNELLDKFEFTDIEYHTAKLGNTEIWIQNQPYSCMYPYVEGINRQYRASRLTIKRGLKKLNLKPTKESELKKALNSIREANGLIF